MKASTLLLLACVGIALTLGGFMAIKMSSGFRDFLNLVGREG